MVKPHTVKNDSIIPNIRNIRSFPVYCFLKHRVEGESAFRKGRASLIFGILLADKMCMLDTIRAKRGELYRIADRNKADKLYVFGSCARQEESEDSDVDFLVRFRKDASLLDQVGIANEFRDFLGRQVDVVSTGSLRRAPRFAHQVLSDYVAI